MKINFKVFLKGAVIIILTAPFLFGQELPKLTLKDIADNHGIASLTSLARKINNNVINSFSPFPSNAEDSLKTDSTFRSSGKNKKFRMKKSPTLAALLSAVLPGAGQFYNQSYWKIPIIDGFVVYFAYEYFRNNNLYKENRDIYITTQTPENPEGDLNYKSLRNFYRDQRDNFVWYFLIVYTINIIDAYVDAHLFDFDVKEEKLTQFGDSPKIYRLKFSLKL
jgi:hypothetical protein